MRNRNIVRQRITERFIELHLPLFKEQPKDFCHHDYKSESGRKIVELARTKIGYSRKTADMDLYFGLMNKYKKLQSRL